MNQSEVTTMKPALSSVLIQTLVPAGVGVIFFYYGKTIPAMVLWAISGTLLTTGILIPPVFHRIEQFGRRFGKWVGIAVTWLLMVPVFFLVFMPGRLILKFRGIDPMCREFPTDAPTYWVPRKPVTDVEGYKRQF